MRFCLLGDEGVGKSNLIRQLQGNSFCYTHYSTIFVKEEPVSLNGFEAAVVDTPGSALHFEAEHKLFPQTDVFTIVCSCVNRKSIQNISHWRNVIENSSDKQPTVWLLFTHNDLAQSHVIDEREMTDIAEKQRCRGFFRVDGTDQQMILQTFSAMAEFVRRTPSQSGSVLFAPEVKVGLVGLSDVGCSALVTRFATNSFRRRNKVGNSCQFVHRFLSVNSKKVKVSVCEVSGMPQWYWQSLLSIESFDALGFVFDLTSRDSLMGLTALLRSSESSKLKILIGTKSDLTAGRAVTADDVEAFFRQENMDFYFETSAKTGNNILATFQAVAEFALGNGQKL